MTREELRIEIAKLLDEYEETNNNEVMGCYLEFFVGNSWEKIYYTWDGGSLCGGKREHKKIAFVDSED